MCEGVLSNIPKEHIEGGRRVGQKDCRRRIFGLLVDDVRRMNSFFLLFLLDLFKQNMRESGNNNWYTNPKAGIFGVGIQGRLAKLISTFLPKISDKELIGLGLEL